MSPPPTYLIVGASRGIGRELLRQLLHTSCTVIATARNPPGVQRLHTSITTSTPTPAAHYHLLPCDVDSDASIATLAQHLAALALPSLDRVFLNAGILEYPTRIAETSAPARPPPRPADAPQLLGRAGAPPAHQRRRPAARRAGAAPRAARRAHARLYKQRLGQRGCVSR